MVQFQASNDDLNRKKLTCTNYTDNRYALTILVSTNCWWVHKTYKLHHVQFYD